MMNNETSSVGSTKEMASMLDHAQIDELIKLALQEDGVANDLTTACCDKRQQTIKARVIVKSPTVLSGGPLVTKILSQAGAKNTKVSFRLEEGQLISSVAERPLWFELEGPIQELLSTERVILNFLMRMSGIATFTRQIVDSLNGTSCKLLHTRKTAPGHRRTDIYACLTGGAFAHRRSLDDAILVKENHIRSSSSWQSLGDGITVNRSKARFVEIEVTNLMELKHALSLRPDRILLDNFSVGEIKKAVTLFGSSVALEASGGINITNAKEYAQTGVDYISMGALTHSAPAADLSMLFEQN